MQQLRTQNPTNIAADFPTLRVEKDCLIPLPIKENEHATT